MRRCCRRAGRLSRKPNPYGHELWQQQTAKALGLESALRSPGRPRQQGGGTQKPNLTPFYPPFSDKFSLDDFKELLSQHSPLLGPEEAPFHSDSTLLHKFGSGRVAFKGRNMEERTVGCVYAFRDQGTA